MTTRTPPFRIVPRPRFAHWMFLRNLKPADVSGHLEVHEMTVGRYLLPFGDKRRRIPDRNVMPRIVRLTAGECPADSFYEHAALEGEADEAYQLLHGYRSALAEAVQP